MPPKQITLYALALLVVMGLFAAGGFAAWKKRGYWVRQLTTLHLESLELAGETKGAFQQLNVQLLHFEISRQPAGREKFEADAEAFGGWLKKQEQELDLPETRDILRQLMAEYEHYRKDAALFLASLPPTHSVYDADELLAQIDEDTRRILELESRLVVAQHDAFQSLIKRGLADTELLQRVIQGLMLLMLVCVGALAAVGYRDMIAPLRRTVRESRALLERQEKLSALGLVAAGLAHEIRNPLNSIKARLFTQRRALGAASPGLEDNQFIDEEVDRLEGIVQGALQFARPAAPAFERVRLTAALESLCELVRPALKKSDISLDTDLRTEADISANPGQLKQALLNLVNNAADSIGRGGVITLRARSGQMRRDRLAVPAVTIEVQDSGKGISKEAQARLFDPFFTTKANGTGLGLSITARIVHAHGGLIECQSPPGRGALFRILLPIVYEKDPRPA